VHFDTLDILYTGWYTTSECTLSGFFGTLGSFLVIFGTFGTVGMFGTPVAPKVFFLHQMPFLLQPPYFQTWGPADNMLAGIS